MCACLSKGVLIVFEGIDGTGKSTQLRLLADALITRGYPVITTREPTEGAYGKKIRRLYAKRDAVTSEEELRLFLDDRREHVEEFLAPTLRKKKVILCDRYFLSTVAYQGAAGLDVEEILRLNSFAPEPDLALIFQAAPALSVERITEQRGDAPNDFERVDALAKAASIFDSLNFPYIRRIDASGTIEAVHVAILKNVDGVLRQHQQQSTE